MQDWTLLSEKEREAMLNATETIDTLRKTVERTVVTKAGREQSAPAAVIRLQISFEDINEATILSLAFASVAIKYQARLRAEWRDKPELISTYNKTFQRIDAGDFLQSLGRASQRTDAEKASDFALNALKEGIITEEQYNILCEKKAALIRKATR